MRYEFTPRGVCANKIEFDINNGVINDVRISGGCPGHGLGVAKLVEGMKADDVIERLESIRCGGRPSSCPAQLAAALKSASD
ncbi:MAG: TIGR03905 family TSCPD domain-containing protein [Oscillospiraceae bacterium]|nr:TIGR03905 family TSCPD domain-containing protein [Oscillospiraceae bacterium]